MQTRSLVGTVFGVALFCTAATAGPPESAPPGGPAIPDAIPDWSLTDAAKGELLGWYGQSAGDFDGDGIGDVIVGDPLYGLDVERGAAFIFFGSTAGLPGSGLPPEADLFDALWSAEGDPFSNLGGHVASVGDVNGDGKGDVVVRSFAEDVFVYYGTSPSGPAIPDWSLSDCASGAVGGVTATGAGDVNADGFDDVLIHCDTDVGVFFGSASGLKSCAAVDCTIGEADWRHSEPNAITVQWQWYGFAAGDVNADGFDDVIFTYDADPFLALAFYGPLSGTASSADADWVFASDHFLKLGRSGGDLDCDGFDDVVIQEGSSVGQVHVFLGSETGLKSCGGPCGAADVDWTVSGVDRPSGAGDDLIFVGFPEVTDDFGGDGHDDLIVTAQFNHDDASNPDLGEPGVGIFFGGLEGLPNCAGTDPPSCLITDAPWIVTMGSQDTLNGGNVIAASAGDVNGDNGPDIIVSYPFLGTGKSLVYHGIPDLDGDGFSVPGGDCDDAEAGRYPGAAEALDGIDNQCPLNKTGDPDPGSGVVDEMTPSPDNFTDQPGAGELCWTGQSGATAYEIVAARHPAFGPTPAAAGCSKLQVASSACVSEECCVDAGYGPLAGQVFHFLVRGSQPLPGVWGLGGTPPVLRDACPDNLVENGDFEFGPCFGGVQQLNSGSRIPIDYAPLLYPGEPWTVQGPVELTCRNDVRWLPDSGSRDVTLLFPNTSSIRQTIEVQSNQTYTVTFSMGASDVSTGQVALEVAVDLFGTSNFTDAEIYTYDVPPGGFDGSAGQWQIETYAFTSMGPQQVTLRFRTVTVGGGAPTIDSVTVTGP